MLDVTKPVQLRDGRLARILCTNLRTNNQRPLVVAYKKRGDGFEISETRRKDGRVMAGADGPLDVVNVPEKKIEVVPVYIYEHVIFKGRLFASSNSFTAHRLLKAVNVEVEIEQP